MVEAAAPGARGVREDAVERRPAALVGVESLVQEVAEEAPSLRHAVGDAVARRRDARGVVLEVRDHVAHGGEPGAHHHGVLRPVDHLVDPAGLEARGEVHTARIGDGHAELLARKLPLGARNRAALAEGIVAHGEDVGAVGGIRHGVPERLRAPHPMTERDAVRRRVDRDVAANEPRDRMRRVASDG